MKYRVCNKTDLLLFAADDIINKEITKKIIQICPKCRYQQYESSVLEQTDFIIRQMKREIEDFIEDTKEAIKAEFGEDIYTHIILAELKEKFKDCKEN